MCADLKEEVAQQLKKFRYEMLKIHANMVSSKVIFATPGAGLVSFLKMNKSVCGRV